MSVIEKARHSHRLFLLPILGPPTVWSLHFLLCYLLVTATTIVGTFWMRVEIILATVVALALIGFCALAAEGYSMPPEDSEVRELPEFMHGFGLASCALFAVATLFTLIPAVALREL